MVELKWDLDGIRWLQDNVVGSPVVLEAHNQQYHWSSRVSNYTGLPTVLGWPWHQIQQRYGYRDSVYQRADAITEMYSTQSISRAQQLLSSYDVKYIVVGELETTYYPAEGLHKFDKMVGDGLLIRVFRNERVKIYEVLW